MTARVGYVPDLIRDLARSQRPQVRPGARLA